MKTKRHNVFISHSSKNSEEVKALKERLLAMGHEVRNSSIEKEDYRDYKVKDETIERDLREGIQWAGTCILLIGKDTLKSDWVKYEIEYACKKESPLLEFSFMDSQKKLKYPTRSRNRF